MGRVKCAGIGPTQRPSCSKEEPCYSAAAFSLEREELGEWSGEKRQSAICGKGQSASEGVQG